MVFGVFKRRVDRSTRGAAGNRSRLRVEALEDRLTPATFNVTTKLDVVNPVDGVLSLREAVTRANSRAGGDTILLPAGVFRIALVGADDTNAAGDFDVSGDTLIRGAGAGLTVIDAQQIDRVFDVLGTAPSSIRVAFQGLTVRNGLSSLDGLDGGGIQFGNADLVFRDCAVTGNRAAIQGGGITNNALPGTGNITLIRTLVSRNVAGLSGGGVMCVQSHGLGGIVVARDSAIRRNIATVGTGGGVLASTANLTNSIVTGNSAGDAGGIAAATASLTNCAVSGNFARTEGGGIFATEALLINCTVSGNFAGPNGGGGISAGTATLTNCTVSGNSAGGSGGGMAAITANLTNCTVSGNSTTSQGGGMMVDGLTLLNTTITENSAHTGGGVFLHALGTSSIRNTIIAQNLVDLTGVGPDVFGNFTSGGHNLIGDGTGSTELADGVNGDRVGTAANPIDPRLGPLKKNGGPTRTHALLPGSPAIDRGDNTSLPPTDQRGAARRKDGDGNGRAVADIGALEL
jgi:hypothetical protein